MNDVTRVLFLDVDGVLNQCGYQQDVITKKAEMVRRIVRETGCAIVVSSAWRRSGHMRELLVKLLRASEVEVSDWTPCLDMITESGLYRVSQRGEEIQAWLDDHPEVKRFVILDDCMDMAHLMEHLLQTDSFVGLTEELTDEVVRRMSK